MSNVKSIYEVYQVIVSQLSGDTFFGTPENVLTMITSGQKTQAGFPANINAVNIVSTPRIFTNTNDLLHKTFEVRAVWNIWIYRNRQHQMDGLVPPADYWFQSYYTYTDFLEKFMKYCEHELNNAIVVDTMGESGGEFIFEQGTERWYGGKFQFQTKSWTKCSNLEDDL